MKFWINPVITASVSIMLGLSGDTVTNNWEAWAIIGLCAVNGYGWTK